MVSDIIRYENGEMDDEEVVSFFVMLRDSGVLWHLQGSYQRMYYHLVECGLIADV